MVYRPLLPGALPRGLLEAASWDELVAVSTWTRRGWGWMAGRRRAAFWHIPPTGLPTWLYRRRSSLDVRCSCRPTLPVPVRANRDTSSAVPGATGGGCFRYTTCAHSCARAAGRGGG